MGSEQNEKIPKVNELTTRIDDKNTLKQSGSIAQGSGYVLNADSENNDVNKLNEVVMNLHNVPYIYRQDIVRHKNTGTIGKVNEVTGEVFGPWLGRNDVLDNVTMLIDDGSMCKVTGAKPLHLKPKSNSTFDVDENIPYYPGQRVRVSSSSVLKKSWFQSSLWKANQLEGTVTKVTVGSVFIYWIASSVGYGPDSSIAFTEEQNPKNLKLLQSSSITSDQGLSTLRLHDSIKSELNANQLENGCDSKEVSLEESDDNNESMDIDPVVAPDVIKRNIGSKALSESSSCVSSTSVSKDPVHETWLPHQRMIRKIYVEKKASDDINNASEARPVGVVKSGNAKERTACVRWLKPVTKEEDPHEFDKEEIVSVYELDGHPNYSYSYGDVVVRSSQVPVGPQTIFVVGQDDDDDVSVTTGHEVSYDAASRETVDDDDEMDALENAQEEIELQNDANVNSEAEESVENNNSGRKPAPSFPLAALDFVTRLATGNFSQGWKNIGENGLNILGKGILVMRQACRNLIYGKVEEHAIIDLEVLISSNAVENLCNLSTDKYDASTCFEDDTCSLKHFDIAKDPLDHYFLGSNSQINNGRKWLKKVYLTNGIYLRVSKDQMDLLRAVISAYHHSGGWQINPNLYEEGNVCLRLLNTWTGRANEVWDPMSFSILQVLVSLQGLGLNSKPYFNEAGYDKQTGTACDAYMKGNLIGSLTKSASLSNNDNNDLTSVGFKLMLA
ncbi:hypothetical protein P3X46_010646 [Hevea brasiliensis]|uniref:Uncharacterized protein n=1 Tax=Hevea brasiliensis TaxID=3981 RepID=A0ABQ9MF11_HEVBR|nr:hypothetical protein P3X46_010646 [Hevea brasiliensis]